MRRHGGNIFERTREAEFNRSIMFVEAGQHIGEMSTGFRGITDYYPWHLQYAVDDARTGFEKRCLSSSLCNFPHFQGALESLHFFSSDFMVDFTAIPIMLGCGSSRSSKRKFSFADDIRSVRPCTSFRQTRLVRRLGGSRVDSVVPVLISAPTSPFCDWLHYPRYNDGVILPSRFDTVSPMQSEVSRQNSEASSSLPFATWRSRRRLEMPESGGFSGLRSNSLASQVNNVSSAAEFGCRNFQGESFIHPSFIETSRDSFSEYYVGAYSRRYHVNDGVNDIETVSSNERMLNSFDPSSGVMFYRTGRHSSFRESASRSSQSAPLEVFEISSRLTHEPEVGLVRINSPYVPVHGQGITSSTSYTNESGNATQRSAPYRIPRRRRRQRIIRRQRLSRGLPNQSLEYEEANTDSPHGGVDLDVDEMSYEELLVLEERIGNVETGLSEDSIRKCLKLGKHCALSEASSVTSQKNEVLCSICQEEFRENDELGLLVCGHSHHPPCIKQWLRFKNQCPVCKAAAYSKC